MYSIEFDRDCDYFAIAGVTKKIKVAFFSAIYHIQQQHFGVFLITVSLILTCTKCKNFDCGGFGFCMYHRC